MASKFRFRKPEDDEDEIFEENAEFSQGGEFRPAEKAESKLTFTPNENYDDDSDYEQNTDFSKILDDIDKAFPDKADKLSEIKKPEIPDAASLLKDSESLTAKDIESKLSEREAERSADRENAVSAKGGRSVDEVLKALDNMTAENGVSTDNAEADDELNADLISDRAGYVATVRCTQLFLLPLVLLFA